MEEKWKDIKGYEGLYQVSNLGNVKSLNYRSAGKEHLISPGTDRGGYNILVLCKGKKAKSFKVHRLVANAFIPNPKNKEQVNHKDGNKQNNKVDNLEWCTCKENMHHAWKTGLYKGGIMDVNKQKDIKYIKDFSKINIRDICKELNIDKSNVYRGIASAEKIRQVKEELQKRIENLKD
jgi:hypothetical protein